jgi:hypothetical protein
MTLLDSTMCDSLDFKVTNTCSSMSVPHVVAQWILWITPAAAALFIATGCAPHIQSPLLPVGLAQSAAITALRPGTVFISSAPDSSFTNGVFFAAPPYRNWKEGQPYLNNIPLALRSDGALFGANDSQSGELWMLPPPYRYNKFLDSGISSAISMAIDKNGNVFLSQAHGTNSYVREYVPPAYKPGPWVGRSGRSILETESVVTLPSGQLAIASVGAQGSKPGGIDLFSPKSHGFAYSHSVSGISYPREIILGNSGSLVASWCSPCASGHKDYVGIIPSPYDKARKTIALPAGAEVLGLAIDANRTIFVCEQGSKGTQIVRYPYPYASRKPLPKTSGCYGAFGVSPSGVLMFARPDPIYNLLYDIVVLDPPYSGAAKKVQAIQGLPETILFAGTQ